MEDIKFLSSFPFNVESEADKKTIVEEKSNDNEKIDETIDEQPVDKPLVEEPVKVAMESEQTETETV